MKLFKTLVSAGFIALVVIVGFSAANAQTTPTIDIHALAPGIYDVGGFYGWNLSSIYVPSDFQTATPQHVNIAWKNTGATSCTGGGELAGVTIATNSSYEVPALTLGTHIYSVTCTGSGGSATGSVTVTVVPRTTLIPTINLSLSPASIANGSGTTLTWSATSPYNVPAPFCVTNGRWTYSNAVNGVLPASGTQLINSLFSADAPGPFGLQCTNVWGTATKSINIAITGGTAGTGALGSTGTGTPTPSFVAPIPAPISTGNTNSAQALQQRLTQLIATLLQLLQKALTQGVLSADKVSSIIGSLPGLGGTTPAPIAGGVSNGVTVGGGTGNVVGGTTPPASVPPTPAPTATGPARTYVCGSTFGPNERTEAGAAITKLQAEAAAKDISNPLPKTSSGVQPKRSVGTQPIATGSFVISCMVGGFGGSPIWTSYAQRVGLPDEAMRWAGVSGETLGQRFDRLSKRFCNDNQGNFPNEYEFSSCQRLYEELADGSAGALGFRPAGDILPRGSLLPGETATTQVLASELYRRLAEANPLPIPTRASIEANQWKYKVSQQQWDLLVKRQVDIYNQNWGGASCNQSGAQMKADHEQDLIQYPINGKAKADPAYQVGAGYEHLMTEFSRLNVCTLAYLGAKEVKRLNPFITDHSVPSIMQANASTYDAHEQVLLHSSVPGMSGYAETFYTANGYDWDNTIKAMEGLYYELMRGNGGIINYCDAAVPRISGRPIFEKAIDGYIASNSMKQSHGSLTGCDVLTYDCKYYSAVQCQANYPSKYCGTNFQPTWDAYCK